VARALVYDGVAMLKLDFAEVQDFYETQSLLSRVEVES
jgi:hypothetical protein